MQSEKRQPQAGTPEVLPTRLSLVRSVEAQRADVLDALEARFGAVPAAIRARVAAVSEPARLTELHRKAVTTPGLATFTREA